MQTKNLAALLDQFLEEADENTSTWHFIAAKVIVLHQDILKGKTLNEIIEFIDRWIHDCSQMLQKVTNTDVDQLELAGVLGWFNDHQPSDNEVNAVNDFVRDINCGYTKLKRVPKHSLVQKVPQEVINLMSFVRKYLHDHCIVWDCTPFYKGVCDNEHHICLLYNGNNYNGVEKAVGAYNKKYNTNAYIAEAHHLFLPL